jgi:hypothetical protein
VLAVRVVGAHAAHHEVLEVPVRAGHPEGDERVRLDGGRQRRVGAHDDGARGGPPRGTRQPPGQPVGARREANVVSGLCAGNGAFELRDGADGNVTGQGSGRHGHGYEEDEGAHGATSVGRRAMARKARLLRRSRDWRGPPTAPARGASASTRASQG